MQCFKKCGSARYLGRFILLLALVGLAVMLLCRTGYAHSGDNEAFTGEDDSNGPSEVRVDADGRKALGIKVEPARRRKMQSTLKATGEVQADETQSFDVTPTVSGIVKDVLVKQGDTVRKGQTLAVVHSIEVAANLTKLLNDRARISAEAAKIKTQLSGDIALQTNQVQLTNAAFEREEQLFHEGISSKRNYLEAKNSYESAKVRLTTLQQQLVQQRQLLERQLKVTIDTAKGELKIMGIDDQTVNACLNTGKVTADLPILAPVDGCVTFRAITLGERVDSAKKVFAIVNLTPIWVMVDIYQEQIPSVKEGQSVIIQAPSKQVLNGRISSVGSIVDTTTKTLHVRIISDNAGKILRPGMFVTAQVAVGGPEREVLSVPDSAVVYDKERPLVYVEREGKFEPVFVTLGARFGRSFEILDGIKEGDPVVTSGGSQLRSEGLLKPGIEGQHEHEKHENHREHEAEETQKISHEAEHLILFVSGLFAALVLVGGFFFLSKRLKNRGTGNRGE